MAFSVPDHLPRKAAPKDVSTEILTRVSETSVKALTSTLAAAWVSELDGNILATKDKIHNRIHSELPDFERQLSSAKSVQTRLLDLSTNVDHLTQVVSDPDSGLVPSLLRTLTAHSTLAQSASDAQALLRALDHLEILWRSYTSVLTVVNQGDLPEGAAGATQLWKLADGAPVTLVKAKIMEDVKLKLRALQDRVQEQLSEAYSRSIKLTSTELNICPYVQVRQSQAVISLPDILRSLSSDSLESHLSSLRREIISKFIEVPLQQPVSSSVDSGKDRDGAPVQTLSLFPLPVHIQEDKKAILKYLGTLFDFLSQDFFSLLPDPPRTSFPRSLCKPTTQRLLQHVIVPSLPSSLAHFSQFISFLEDAVKFEEEYIIRLLGEDSRGEPDIKSWAAGVAAHYGRKRREDLLKATRELILSDITNTGSARGKHVHLVEVEVDDPHGVGPVDASGAVPAVVPVQGDIVESTDDTEQNAWDFDDEATEDAERVEEGSTETKPTSERNEELDPSTVADEWGLDEEVEDSAWDFDEGGSKEESEQSHSSREQQREASASDSSAPSIVERVESDDGSAAWGLADENDSDLPELEEEQSTKGSEMKENGNGHTQVPPPDEDNDASSWDDPWGEPGAEIAPTPSAPTKQPKVAKRLEKLTSKSKGKPHAQSQPESPYSGSTLTSPVQASIGSPHSTPATSFTPPRISVPTPSQTPHNAQKTRPPDLPLATKQKRKEAYAISNLAKEILHNVKEILSEGRATSRSHVFDHLPPFCSMAQHPGHYIIQTAPLIFDMYRALYPISAGKILSENAGRSMRFSNDCVYLSDEISKLETRDLPVPFVRDQLHEQANRTRSLADWWYDETIERQCQNIYNILKDADGFTDTGDQERYDECESAMTETLRFIRSVAHQWKDTLTRTKYYTAIGNLVNFALATVVNAILALPDIPEVDSHRLSELCRILNALEGLFVEDWDESSFVVTYVPSWLKYSYLSELLEASIADISYLFDEGALIDFDVEELVSLVKALFADTPLRSNTIDKLRRGHPVVT